MSAKLCNKILVAFDDSPQARKALKQALALCEMDPDVELVLLHVTQLYNASIATGGIFIPPNDEAREIEDELKLIAGSISNNASVHVLNGSSPADVILKCAEDEGCDLIIMGSRGKGGLGGYIGSVSYGVIKGSPISVVVTKEDD